MATPFECNGIRVSMEIPLWGFYRFYMKIEYKLLEIFAVFNIALLFSTINFYIYAIWHRNIPTRTKILTYEFLTK